MKKTPKLRFPEFSREWEEKKLGSLCTFLKGSGLSKDNISTDGKPCILYGELYTKYGEVISKVYSKTNLDGENFVYSKQNDVLIPSSGETAIDIATASCVQDDGVILGGDLNIMRSTEINGIFLSYQLNNAKRNDLAKVAQGASVVHIYNDQLKKISVSVPEGAEQDKIASFFSLIDKKIEKQQEKVEALEEYKKGIMQKIFSQEIRFKKDDGGEYPEWENKKISKCFLERVEKDNLDLQLLSVSINKGVIKRSDIEGKDNSSDDKSNYKLVEINDIVYNSMRMWQGASGISEYRGIVSPAYTVLIPLQNICSKYFSYVFKSEKVINEFRKFSQGLTSDTWNLKYPLIKEIKVDIPCKEEQTKIADFLSNIDNIIEKEKEKLKDLREWKKGLLQQMFV